MRSRVLFAAAVIASVVSYAPELAKMSEAEACRLGGRIERARRLASGNAMGMGELQEWASRRRRARQTHPGKRGKR